MHYDVLMSGNYFCDLIFTGLPAFPALGTEVYTSGMTVVPGGVLNTVVALRRLGLNVGWIGAFGDDFFSAYVAEWIAREGVDTALVERLQRPLRRVTVAMSYPADRAFVTYVDTPPDTLARLIDEAEQYSFRCLHFSRLYADERLPQFIRRCRARGIFVSMDCQHREETLAHPVVRQILAELDLFIPNAIEAQRITAADSLTAAAERLTAVVPLLVVKDGINGAHAWRSGQHVHAPALRLSPLDTTGAGDVFNAGFLAAHLAGHDLHECLRWGNAAGGLSTLGYGGCSNAPTREGLLARLAEPS